jgi:hypothetical protein
MKTKLAGHLPLQEAIARTIEEAREKMKLAADESDKDKTKKLLAFEKKEHGHIPSVKEEKAEYEKTSSVLDPTDPEDVEKLAAALDFVSEKLADSIENGGESHQGGQQLPTQSPTGGRQSYSFGQATKKHQVPNSTGLIVGKDNPGAKTAVPTDDHRAPGGNGAKYPPKGPFKTASVNLLQDVLAAETGIEKDAGKFTAAVKSGAGKVSAFLKGRPEAYRNAKKGLHAAVTGKGTVGAGKNGMTKRERLKAMGGAIKSVGPELGVAGAAAAGGAAALKLRKGKKGKKKHASSVSDIVANLRSNAGHGFRRAVQAAKDNPGKAAAGAAALGTGAGFVAGRASKEKKSAIDYILGKISAVENGGESKQGGEQLSNTAPVPSNPGRQMISSNAAPKAATKREAKAPQKKLLKEVLTEPAQSASTDPVVKNNLRNASKGGVKIAAARAFLQKVAEEGCKCEDAGTCRYCKMNAATSKPAA